MLIDILNMHRPVYQGLATLLTMQKTGQYDSSSSPSGTQRVQAGGGARFENSRTIKTAFKHDFSPYPTHSKKTRQSKEEKEERIQI